MREQVLVVSGDNTGLHDLVTLLNGAGYEARGVGTFAEARQLLGSMSPELVIADERLGGFNGIHLAIVGRARDAHMKAIVVSRRKDPVLESEARRLHIPCLVAPIDPAGWLASISRTLESTPDPTAVNTAN